VRLALRRVRQALAAGLLLALSAGACSAPEPQSVGPAASSLGDQDVRLVTAEAGVRPAGRVVDRAELLTAEQETALTARLEAHEKATTDQVVIVTVQSLRGLPVERFGYTLGNAWGIGRADVDNGVLLIVAPAQRQVRIEVGMGLAQVLTDDQAAQIIGIMTPRLRAGSHFAAIEAGAAGIIAALKAKPERRRAS